MEVEGSVQGQRILIMTDLSIERVADHRMFVIPKLATSISVPPGLEGSSQPVNVPVKLDGLFRITLTAANGIPGRSLLIISDLGGNNLNLNVELDRTGQTLFWGNPGDCYFSFPEGSRLVLEPVEI